MASSHDSSNRPDPLDALFGPPPTRKATPEPPAADPKPEAVVETVVPEKVAVEPEPVPEAVEPEPEPEISEPEAEVVDPEPTPPSAAEAMLSHAEGSISEDAVLGAVRERAHDIGAGAVSAAAGALLSLLARLSGGKAVVEVGTGVGLSGLWLLSGMRADGVLTTIDIEPEYQRIARQAFVEGGIGPSRTRLISGRAQEVLTRLADASYDLVFIDGDPADQPDYVAEGIRLLRPGGVIVVHRAALGGRAGDPNAHDATVAAVREAARMIAEDERLAPVLIPLSDGILAAAREHHTGEG